MSFLTKILIAVSTLLIFGINNGWAQEPANASSTYEEKDSIKSRNGSFMVLPIITYSPETSLRLGAIGIYFFRGQQAPEGTQLSTVKLPINYTLNNQIKVRLSYEIFSNANKHIFKGVVEWIQFPLQFWGIGNNTPDSNEEIYTTRTLTWDFNYLAKVRPGVFLGTQFIQQSSKISELDEDGQLIQEGLIPGNDGALTSGLGIIARYDRRDNNFNATTGPYVQGNLTTYQSWLGSDYEFTKLRLDLRHYLQTFEKRHVLAFNLVAEHNWGTPTFETMALLGGDQIMRGHYLGRFRDNTMLAAQMEYRFPLIRKSWIDEREKMPFLERWGMVGFVGFGNVAPSVSGLGFEHLKSSWGLGLRYAAKPEERLNIRIDFGFGTQNPGFYLNIRESF
jgi:outer membrane protein assembly factor BamA